MRQYVVVALQRPEFYADKIKDVGASTECLVQCASCNTAVTFTDNDLLLGSKPYNRPLFVTGYIREQKVRCIFVDGGSTVNIMPKST